MRTNFPIFCTSPRKVRREELIRLFYFSMQPAEIADLADVKLSEVQAWKEGKKPVPLVVVRLLQAVLSKDTIQCDSPWSGARAQGSRLVLDDSLGYSLGIEFDELARLNEYRRLYHLGTMQADLIDRLITERDFYRHNCHQVSRYGMLLNSIFPPPPDKDVA
jgi:hypothetical protein